MHVFSSMALVLTYLPFAIYSLVYLGLYIVFFFNGFSVVCLFATYSFGFS